MRPGAPGPLLKGIELEVASELNGLAVLSTPRRQLLHLPDVRLRRLNGESVGARDQGYQGQGGLEHVAAVGLYLKLASFLLTHDCLIS